MKKTDDHQALDAVEMTRTIRNSLSAELRTMSHREQQEFIVQRLQREPAEAPARQERERPAV